jgi:glycosyltransferase involved in cell wall biosynthesis
MTDYRKAYGLPERYFLSLGRMVEKKNLSTLVEAYARFARASGEKHGAGSVEHGDTAVDRSVPSLVFVGSGELEGALREQARGLGLRVVDRTEWIAGQSGHSRTKRTEDGPQANSVRRSRGQIDKEPCEVFSHSRPQEDRQLEELSEAFKLTRMDEDGSERPSADRTEGNAASPVIAYGPSTALWPPVRAGCDLSAETTDGGDAAATSAEDCKLNTEHSVEKDRGTVFFYGFRQIEENAVFYALAEAFVLPSLYEEWGLVVNEAMACSLPVIVSRTAGCAEDLLPGSESFQCSVGRAERSEPQIAPRQTDGSATTAAPRDRSQARSIQSGKNADADDCKPQTENSLEQRSNGFVFDPRSVDALATALARVADCGTADGGDAAATLRAVMGRRSREIVAKFSCENFARQAMRAACAARGGGCESCW